MGITKSFHFSEDQNKLATYAKALAHPARIAILQQILKNGTCIVGSLSEVLPLSQSTISQHLKELKTIGIIRGEITGPSICYCIDAKSWTEAKSIVNELFSAYKEECC
ncbi:MAG: metalloregulator ArsR/SmtB family transcription factor [Cyclobacteriaceae bacterium]|nr:metalloregulator ArsR/SmtB family transcription factor [Cyclobacteriaceae bacterium]